MEYVGKTQRVVLMVGICSICCILPIVGVIFLAIGLSAEDGDSKNDFDYMVKPCFVVDASHTECHVDSHQDSQGTGHCYDCYTYSFTATTREGEVYMSTGERVSRNDGYCKGNKALGSFYVGQAVGCWSPKVRPPPSFYRCANPACYKIIDPAVDSKEAVAWKAGKMLVGYCCLGFGFGFPLVWALLFSGEIIGAWRRYRKMRLAAVQPTVVGRDDEVLPEEDLLPCESPMPVVGDQ